MLGHTHVAIAATTTGGVMLLSGATFTESLPVIAVAGLCALIPDIDEPNSKIGRKLPIVSHIIKKIAGHRGATHSIYAAILFAAVTISVGLGVWGTAALPYCLAAAWGYASHLYAGDAWTVSGVPWPGKAQNVGIPRNQFNRKFKTGSPKETTLFLILMIIGAAEGAALYGKFPQMPHIRIPALPSGIPNWLYPPAWTVFVGLALAIFLVLWTWSRWHCRLLFSRNSMTYKIYFSFHSEDLPLRSEQLGNLLHNLALPKRLRFFMGQPLIRITYASDGEKALYITFPDSFGFPEKIRDALLDKLRGARIEKVDFDIPKTDVHRKFGRLKLWRNCPAYSMRTLKGFEMDDPLENVLNTLDVDGGKAYIFLLLKPIGPRWKRNARKVREKIRTLDDGNMDKALKRSGVGGIVGALIRSIAAILSGAFSVFQWTPATADAYLLGTAMKPDAGIKDRRSELSEEVKDIVKSMDDKINCRASFRFEIRIMVEKDGATWHDVDRIAASFRQYDKHNGLKHNRNYWPVSHIIDPLVRMNLWPIFGSKGILSSDELAGFLHNPWKTTTLVKMDLNTSRTEPAAPGLTLIEPGRVYFGTNRHRDGEETISIPWSDFVHHIMICGMSGSGKTTLLKHIILQWIDSGEPGAPRGACFIEPHGDACRELINSIPRRNRDRVYYLNPGDHEYSLAFNPLAYKSIMTSDHIRDTVIAAFKSIWELSPEMANLMMYLPRTMDVLARVDGAHFGWVRPFICNPDFRRKILFSLGDQEAIQFWDYYTHKTRKNREEETRSLLNRIDSFTLDSRLQRIFCQPESKIDFRGIMDEGKIIVCNFGDNNSGPVNKRLLGNLFCSYFHQACQVRAEERRPFLICLDECSEYISPTLADVLSQDRKFGVALCLSFQYMDQVKEVIEAIKGNTTTRISFQVGEEDAQALSTLFTSSSDPDEVRRRSDDLQNLDRFQGFLKSTVNGRPLPPTTFSLSPPLNIVHGMNLATISHNTNMDLCRPGNDVYREIDSFNAAAGLSENDKGSDDQDKAQGGKTVR